MDYASLGQLGNSTTILIINTWVGGSEQFIGTFFIFSLFFVVDLIPLFSFPASSLLFLRMRWGTELVREFPTHELGNETSAAVPCAWAGDRDFARVPLAWAVDRNQCESSLPLAWGTELVLQFLVFCTVLFLYFFVMEVGGVD